MRKLPFRQKVSQRTRLYFGRATRSVMRTSSTRKCLFMHVPKCGGTSVAEALYATVPLEEKIGLLPSNAVRESQSFLHLGEFDLARFHDEGEEAEKLAAFREQLVLMHLAYESRLVHGHFLFTPRIKQLAMAKGYDPITILRSPVDRTISNYRMALRNKMFEGSFDAFLESEMGRRMALHTLRYFSGRVSISPEDEGEALLDAKANLALFPVIGFLDDLDKFSESFRDNFGVRPRIPHFNKGTGSGLDLGPATVRRLETLCAPDHEIYELAKAQVGHV